MCPILPRVRISRCVGVTPKDSAPPKGAGKGNSDARLTAGGELRKTNNWFTANKNAGCTDAALRRKHGEWTCDNGRICRYAHYGEELTYAKSQEEREGVATAAQRSSRRRPRAPKKHTPNILIATQQKAANEKNSETRLPEIAFKFLS